MILNPTPVTPQVFNGMWITSLVISLPTATNTKGALVCRMQQYDGTHLLATGNPPPLVIPVLAARRASTLAIDTMLTELEAVLKPMVGSEGKLQIIDVHASDPAKPVSAAIVFTDKKSKRIQDCYALCAEDAAFAAVFSSAMTTIAGLAGLSVE